MYCRDINILTKEVIVISSVCNQVNPELCAGCGACMNICPNDALEMTCDQAGFLIPQEVAGRCIQCNLCVEICPAINRGLREVNQYAEAYGCFISDQAERQRSASGGAFVALAKAVINLGGIVYGASFDEDYHVKHIGVDKIDDLQLLQGSKYLQSEIGYSFRSVEKHLGNNRLVLFSGTPCQIAGLYGYLQDRSLLKNLITVDLICHGVPSERVFQDYLAWLQRKKHSRIKAFTFRSKKAGWNNYGCEAHFENEKRYFRMWWTDPFMIGFINNFYLRSSCYHCPYVGLPRWGDLTIGDFWGVDNEHFDRKGVSVILINSKQGRWLFENLTGVDLFKADLRQVVKHNFPLRQPAEINPKAAAFFELYRSKGFAAAQQKYLKFPALKFILFKIYWYSQFIFGERWYRRLKAKF